MPADTYLMPGVKILSFLIRNIFIFLGQKKANESRPWNILVRTYIVVPTIRFRCFTNWVVANTEQRMPADTYLMPGVKS
jgi:hypothetical protein